MKSSVNQDRFKEWLLKVEVADKEKLLDTAMAYGMAEVSKNEQLIKAAYQVTLECAMQMQEKYQVNFLESPDGNYRKAMLFLVGLASQVKKKRNEANQINFRNAREANAWLLQQKVDVISMELETGNYPGLLANHTFIKKITLHYKKNDNTKYLYHICENEEFGFFIKKNKNKVAARWKERHSELEVVSQKIYSNSRGEALSVAIGFGNYMENVKIITLCRELKK